MIDINILLIYLILISLISSGITAVIIYSEICMPFREFWNWVFNSKYLIFMQSLMYCTLCLGFWISLFVQYALFDFFKLGMKIGIAFGSAFICWMLNSFLQASLWIGAFVKDNFEQILEHRKENK